jgi:hypothetical protein
MAAERSPLTASPTISSDTPNPYTGAVSIRLTPWSNAALIVAMESRSSVPPHIQPPIAQVPSAMRDTMSSVAGIFTNWESNSCGCG